MKIEKKNVIKDNCSCNFCKRGQVNYFGIGLAYPYSDVYEISNGKQSSLVATLCESCIRELIQGFERLNSDKNVQVSDTTSDDSSNEAK